MDKKQFQQVTCWQTKTFGEGSPISRLHHLKEEIDETIVELEQNKSKKDLIIEYADCIMLLYGSAFSAGFTYEELSRAIDEKLKINKKRQWGTATENGIINHIR
jgi:phosphoribosyl-ATP pyrophosphohydrolase